MKRRNENSSNYSPEKKRRIAHTPSWSSISMTNNPNQLRETLDEKARRVVFSKQSFIDDKKDALLANEKENIFKRILIDPVMQIKMVLLEIKKRIEEDKFEVFYISDDNNHNISNISYQVFCFKKGNIQYLYQARHYSQERGTYRKVNYRKLKSSDLNIDQLYRAFKATWSCDKIIVHTNKELDEESLEKKEIRVINNENNTCSIEVSPDSDFFKGMMAKHSNIRQLADCLSKCMKNGILVKSYLINKFRGMLIKEDVLKITRNDNREFIAKFHPNFINQDRALKPVIAELCYYVKRNLRELRDDGWFKVNENFVKGCISQTYSLSEVTDEDSIKTFFKKLQFMTYEEDLEDSIRGIGETFEKIQSTFHVEQLNIVLSEKLKRGRDQADLFLSLERKILGCELLNYQLKKNDTTLTLEFVQNSLQGLRVLLTECRNSTIIVKSDNTRLCASKLQQLSESLPKYSKDRCFLLDIDDLLCAKKHLLTVLSGTDQHLLIVQTDGINLKDEQVKYCIKDIRQQISNAQNVTNKMIIIQNINDPPLELNFDFTEHKELFDDKAGLSKTSQDELSETRCKLYSCENNADGLPLKELLLQPSHLEELLSSAQCVIELVQNRELILETNLVKPIIFEKTYTLFRRLKRQINLNSEVLKKDNNDIFVVFGYEKQSQGNIHYYKDINIAHSYFDILTRQNPKVNVHLLKRVLNRDSIRLGWQRSSRSILPLMKYVIESREDSEQSQSIDDILDRRILILCGSPYSGKSYCLYEMAEKLYKRQIENENHKMKNWIVQINLNNSMMQQGTSSSPLNNPDDAVNMLTKILGHDELRCRLFRLSATGELKMKLSIFVDGLEELSENNVYIVSEILQQLCQTNVERIYVATRPNFRNILEGALDEFAFNLVTFSNEENKSILQNTWISLADENIAEKEVRDSAENALNLMKTLDGILEPLYLQIFARVCWHYLKYGRDKPPMKSVHDILKQYFDIFLNAFEISKRNRFCMHRLRSLLPLEAIRTLKLHEGERFGAEFSKLDQLSFVEYGAAKWLASLGIDDQVKAFSAMQDLASRVSIAFFETFAYNCNEDFYLEYIKRIGNNRLMVELFDQHIWINADRQRKLIYLHTALIYSEDLFKTFLGKYPQSSLLKLINEEQLFKEAAENDKMIQACELILKGAKIENPVNIENFVERVAIHVVSTLVELQPNQLHPYWSIVEKLLMVTPGVSANFDLSVKLPRLLRYFFAHGRTEIIHNILKTLGTTKKQKLLRTRVDNLMPLEIVNSSETMTDEDRLKISRYLNSESTEQNVFSVMTAAAKSGHVKCFKYFAGSNPKRLSDFFKQALRSNQLDVLRFLLRNSEWNVDYTSGVKNQPLHAAVIEGASIKTLKFLLNRGGENNQNSNEETALSLAIQHGVDLRIIKFLVEHNADVNVSDRRSLKPWYYAVLAKFCRYSPEQQLDLMCFLKGKNMKLEFQRPDNIDSEYWDKEIKPKYEYLWDPKTYNLNYLRKEPRLHLALQNHDFFWFHFLLQHGADPNVLDSVDRSPLHKAVNMENNKKLIETVKILLRHGTIFNGVCKKGLTPIHLLRPRKNLIYTGEAFKLLQRAQDFFECIELLRDELKSHNNVQSTALYWLIYCRDNKRRTLLHRAAEQTLPDEDFKNLLTFSERYGKKRCQQAWINAQDVNGETAAHVAARRGNSNMLKELAQKGACLKFQNSKRETPLDLAKKPETYSILEMARNLFRKMQEGSIDKSLLQCTKHFCANIRDETACSLLHLAVRGKDPKVCLELIRYGASVDATDIMGQTPLHYAVVANNLEATKLLIKVGASVDARVNRMRPADQVSNRSSDLVYALAEMLESGWRDELSVNDLIDKLDGLANEFDLEPNVAASACDSDKNTLVHHAVRNNDLELLKALLQRGAVYNAFNAAKRTPMDLADGETKKLLKVVGNIFECPNPDFLDTKIDDVGWELTTQCRKVGGYTLMHTLLEAGKLDAAKWLIDEGVDVDVTNNLGVSARKLAEGFLLIAEI